MNLVVLGPPRLRGHGLQVTAQRAVIGRDEHATLILADERVSRQHAAVWEENGATWIIDLGSRNGTLVNGAPVGRAPRQIGNGDHIGLGDVTLVLEHAVSHAVQYTFAGGQSAGQINNIGRDYNQHNRYDVDINPLPRSRTGRTLIILGVTLKLIGVIPFGYWVVAFMAEVFDALETPAGSQPPQPDLPPFLPWVPIGLVLTMIGTALWIYGAIIAYSTRRRNQ